jgi:hypothetical protein
LSANGGPGTRVSLWAGQGYRWLQVFTGDPLAPDRRAGIMLAGGIVEIFLGVNAAGKSLEQVTKPLTSVDEKT